MPDLTELEAQFFATGELPPELAAQAAEPAVELSPPAVVQPVAAPPQAAVTEAAPDPAEALRKSLEHANAERIRAETRLADMQKQMAEKAAPVQEAPDPTLDPLGNMMHQLQQVNNTVLELQKQLNQQQQNSQMREQVDQFTASIKQLKDQFTATTPDFQAAYDHVRAVRTEDLRMVGIPDSEIAKVLLQDEFNISQNAIQNGRNPAEEMYKMAKRYGYASKSTPATAAPTQTAAALSPAEKLAQAIKGSAAAKQPQRAGAESELTIEGLKDAGDGDLNKLVQDDKLWHRLVGGTSHDIF